MSKYPNNIYYGELDGARYTIVKRKRKILDNINCNYKALLSKKIFESIEFSELEKLNDLLQDGYMSSEEIDELVKNYLDNQTNKQKQKNKVLRKMGIKNDRY